MTIRWKTEACILAGIIALVGFFYGNTISNGFIHDDHGQIETNRYIQSFMYLPKVFNGCIWESAIGNCKDSYYYRPLQSVSYLITYVFSNKPWIFHLVNICYFCCIIFCIYRMVALLSNSTWIGIGTAVIFLIHPIHTEVVNWPAAVPELLYTLFSILATIRYVEYMKLKRSKYAYSFYGFYLLAILSKEPAVFLPLVFIMLDFFYFRLTVAKFFRWSHVKHYVYCFFLFALYMVMRLHVLGGVGADPTMQYSFFERFLIFFDLFGAYVAKLFQPYPLNLFYPYHIPSSWNQPNVLIGLGVFTLYIGLFIVTLRKRWKLVIFSLVWYIIFLTPSLIFTSSIGENLFAERHVFASTIGFSLLITLVFAKIWNTKAWGNLILILCCSTIIYRSYIVVHDRNALWKTDETLYADTLKTQPDADLIRYNLAYLYTGSGRLELAKQHYDIILRRKRWRGMDKVFNNLGEIARKEHNLSLSKEYFEKSLAMNPYHVEAYNNLGGLLLEEGDMIGSLANLCTANRLRPSFEPAGHNLDLLTEKMANMSTTSFVTLFRQIVHSRNFSESSQQTTLFFAHKTCESDNCLLTFSNHHTTQIPFILVLIAGETEKNDVIRPNRVGLVQSNGDIVLEVDKEAESHDILFSFPTCDRNYYQVRVPAD